MPLGGSRAQDSAKKSQETPRKLPGRPQEVFKMAPRPPQEAWKGTSIEAKRLPRTIERGIRTKNVETLKMTTFSIKINDF